MCLAHFSANLERKSDLTNAFKTIFRDDSLSYAPKLLDSLVFLGGARTPARAPARARSQGPQSSELAASLTTRRF